MALSYIGGKSKIGNWIKNYIPTDITTYVEPFSGMFWVFFKLDISKYKDLETVVYNDSNPLNVNLFNCIKNYNDFYEVIKEYKSQDKNLFQDYQKEIFSPDFVVDLSTPDFHTAAKYAYVLSQVWSGTNPQKSKFIDLKGKYRSKFDSFKSKLKNPKWQNYFDKITICENLDFSEIIEKWDSKSTYFYLDPPYFRTETYYANHDFTVDTHQRLATQLQTISGKFSLSYYYFPQLDQWFDKNQFTWVSKEFHKAAMAKSGKAQTKGVELLIMNYGSTSEIPTLTQHIEIDDVDDFDFSI